MTPAANSESKQKLRMEEYTHEAFLPYAGTVFEFEQPGGGTVALELLEVSTSPRAARAEGGRRPFSLLFSLLGSEPLAMGMHRLRHDNFESADWFICRVTVPGRSPEVRYCEAVFG